MKFHGNIDLLNNEMQQMVMQAETNFPDSPTAGRVIFKDKRVYICAEITGGLPVWVPLTNEIDSHMHNQDSSSDTWTVTHNLNTMSPLVQIYDSTHKMVIPDEITVVDNNSVSVTFGTAVIGRAIVMYGDITGGSKSQFAYTHTQTNLSAAWVVNHNLGYNPIVRVFIGTEEIQPLSIIHDDIGTTTITFSETKTGTARFI